MSASEAVMNPFTTRLIKQLEGFSEKSYVDASGRSIGYGHFIKPGEEHLKGKVLSKQEAEDLLAKDIHEHQKGWIDQARSAGMNETQIAGLTSFAYNTGGKAMPEIIRRWKSGDKKAAAELMLSYNKSYNPDTKQREFNKHLYERRQKEITIALEADPEMGMGDTAVAFMKEGAKEFSDFLSVAGSKFKAGARSVTDSLAKMFDSTDSVLAKNDTSIALCVGENKKILAEITAINAQMGNLFSDSDWLQQLRQEGANLHG
jgi:GH24 family phage-related lysozyme (muramidase)